MVQQTLSVAIVFHGSKSLEVVETKIDYQGRISTIDIKLCERKLLLVNLYNANNEKKQFVTLNLLSEMSNNILYIVIFTFFILYNTWR